MNNATSLWTVNLRELKDFLDSKLDLNFPPFYLSQQKSTIIDLFAKLDEVCFKDLKDAIKFAVDKSNNPIKALKLAVTNMESYSNYITVIDHSKKLGGWLEKIKSTINQAKNSIALLISSVKDIGGLLEYKSLTNPEHILCMSFHIFETTKDPADYLKIQDLTADGYLFSNDHRAPVACLDGDIWGTICIDTCFYETSNCFVVLLLGAAKVNQVTIRTYLVVDLKLVDRSYTPPLQSFDSLFIAEHTLKQLHHDASGGKVQYQQHELAPPPQMLLNEPETTALSRSSHERGSAHC